jgi:hypothetical protein
MRVAPSGNQSVDEAFTRGCSPVGRRGRPSLPQLPGRQGEDPLAPRLAPPPRRGHQLRAGRPAGRPVRRPRPRHPQAVERSRPRRPGRPPQGEPESGQVDRRATGRGLRRPPEGAARRRPVVRTQARPVRPRPVGRRGLSPDRLAVAAEARVPTGGSPPPAPEGGRPGRAAEVASTAWRHSWPGCGGKPPAGKSSCGARTRPGWDSSRWPAGCGR